MVLLISATVSGRSRPITASLARDTASYERSLLKACRVASHVAYRLVAGLEKIMILKKSKKNQIFLFKSDLFYFIFYFLHFSVLLCIVVALNNLNFIVSCTLHRIKVPEPVTIN